MRHSLLRTVLVLVIGSAAAPVAAQQLPTDAPEAAPQTATPGEAATDERVDSPAYDAGSWVADAYRGARDALVGVRCGWRRGTGFVFGAGDLVATTDSWDRCTRAIVVTLPDGRTLEVSRGRVSSDDDVAILHLPEPSGVEPLTPRRAPVGVGDPVLALGRTHDGEAVLAAGMVTGESDDTLRTDLERPPGASGAPVLGASGDVVGIVTRHHRWHDDAVRVVPVSRLDALASQGTDEDLGRTFSFGLGAFGALVLDEDPAVEGSDVWLGGFGAALSATLADRLTLVGGFSVLRDASGLFEEGVIKRAVRRYQGEARLGWRLLLSSRFPAYVIPSLGASARWDRWTDRRLRVQLADPTCDLSAGSACELVTDVVRDEQDEFSVTPYVHLALRLGFLEIGYTLSLAVGDAPGPLVHRFVLAAWMGH